MIKKRGINMASSKEYLEYILEQLSDLDDISYRAMMGEYIIYYRGKIVGGIYDDRFLIKPVKSAMAMMPDASMELPYEGAKEMILIDDVDGRDFLNELLDAMYDELPAPRKKKLNDFTKCSFKINKLINLFLHFPGFLQKCCLVLEKSYTH